jgi:broad specificity phosphatase PhoE
MSSLKRATRVPAKRAAKTSHPTAPARAAMQPLLEPGNDASVQAKQLAVEIERGVIDGRLDVLTADALQALLAATCRVYTARVEAGERLAPIAKNALSATDVMVTASGLLRAADLAVFELGMWQGFTGR